MFMRVYMCIEIVYMYVAVSLSVQVYVSIGSIHVCIYIDVCV